MQALVRARAAHPQAAFLDLPYRELTADPLGVLAWLLRALGHPVAELGAPAAWLHQNRQHSAGRHEYTAESFGMRPDALRERFAGL